MDARLRPVVASGVGLMVMFFVIGGFFEAPVPVPGTIYLLVPVLALLAVYLSFEDMARYVSGYLGTEDRQERFSRRIEPIPTPFLDRGKPWLTVSANGYQFFKYVLNQPNVKDGVGAIFVGPPTFFESENRRVVWANAEPIRLTPLAIRRLMQKHRRWRDRLESYDGFDPDLTRVYLLLWSATMHPDSDHPREPAASVAAFIAELGQKLINSGRATGSISKALMDEIHLLSELAGHPDESRAARRELPEQAEGR